MLERLYERTLRLPGWESSLAEPRHHHVSEAFLNLQTNQVTSWTLPSDPSSVQFSSVSRVWLFATPWTAGRQAFLSITNSRSLLKLMSFELVMSSNHLILCRALLLLLPILPSIRVFFKESVLRIGWRKYWSFSFNISPSIEHPGLISFRRLVGSPCSPRDSQQSFPTSQFKSINSSVLSFLYSPTLTSIHHPWLILSGLSAVPQVETKLQEKQRKR